MAALEHFNKDGRDCYRLRFLIDKRRHSVGLGDFDEAAATIAKQYVEHLIVQHRRDRPPNAKTSKWLETLPSEVHDKLSTLGLVEARERCDLPRTVLAFMRHYIKTRTDWAKPANYRQSVDHLEAYLRRDVPITSLTKGDAESWHRWMQDDKDGPKLFANTAGQHVKRCRQMMRHAVDHKLIDVNPFVGVKIDLRSDTSKNRFIDATAAAAILDQCPDQEWRTLYALCRYGGLRCPSEVLRLRWSDIQWDRERFKVTAPKTRRYGKGERIAPLFPELSRELSDLFDIVKPGIETPADAYVITRYRDTEANLRTTFTKIVARAGVAAFPKPFMALRASRRTELERTGRFANHVLNDWFGHSGAIAETHYLQTTEADFAEAAITPPTDPVGQLVGQSVGQPDAPTANTPRKKPRENGALMASSGVGCGKKYTQLDSNQ